MAVPNQSSSSVSLRSNLPREIIRQIFRYLHPQDFNSARHICRAWWLAGFDKLLLRQMLKRAGWLTSATTELEELAIDFPDEFEEVKYLTRRFSRECALQSSWKGCGIPYHPRQPTQDPDPNVFSLAYWIDFSELSTYKGTTCSLSFTVSVCKRFVLASEGCVIYVYEIDNTDLRPITCVVCPMRVLIVSMDTSEDRFSVVALLENRTGLVCDLDYNGVGRTASSPYFSGVRHFEPLLKSGKNALSRTGNIVETTSRLTGSNEAPANIQSVRVRSPHQTVSLLNASRSSEPNMPDPSGQNSTYPHQSYLHPSEVDTAGIALRSEALSLCSSPLSLYHSICSEEDPPRSVAICPSRRCVAFGCGTGIELHWIETVNGRNLMKWFPLTAPSDCLYFMPIRPGLDNPNRLRLISSKAGPGQRAISNDSEGSSSRTNFKLTWSALRYDTGRIEYDHNCAIPVSDGSNILFTDSKNGHLCFGCDCPSGQSTRLLRKVIFLPPDTVKTKPTVYTAASDLTWGVRVLAAYGKHLVLYCIPNDMLLDLQKINERSISIGNGEEEPVEFQDWAAWWDFTLSEDLTSPPQRSAPRPWNNRPVNLPIPIKGIYIGEACDTADVAIQATPKLTLWAFGVDGIARTWQFPNRNCSHVERVVERNGAISSPKAICAQPLVQGTSDAMFASSQPSSLMVGTAYDFDSSDVPINVQKRTETAERGWSNLLPSGCNPTSLDGTNELTSNTLKGPCVSNDPPTHSIASNDISYDKDGDVIMRDSFTRLNKSSQDDSDGNRDLANIGSMNIANLRLDSSGDVIMENSGFGNDNQGSRDLELAVVVPSSELLDKAPSGGHSNATSSAGNNYQEARTSIAKPICNVTNRSEGPLMEVEVTEKVTSTSRQQSTPLCYDNELLESHGSRESVRSCQIWRETRETKTKMRITSA